jgi:hypothetical protein
MELQVIVGQELPNQRRATLRPGQVLLIGRHPDVDLPVSNRFVGRQHCRVGWTGCAPWIEDLDSRNGVFINGRRIAPGDRSPLWPGDEFLLGSVPGRLWGSLWFDPCWLAWENDLILRLVRHLAQEPDLSGLPVLGDALEDAGCTYAEVLAHCREREHARRCWVFHLVQEGVASALLPEESHPWEPASMG